MQLHSIQTGHKDLIHDIQYNFFGNRACTVSSDQVIKVWNTSTGQNDRQKWELIDSWKAHDASVLKVCWAHPEFGQLIASCSFDRTVKIWEEQDDESSPSQKRWKIVGTLSEDFFAIQDLQFAPNHLGLKLAVVGENGMLRIYEALDVVNVGKWALMDEFQITSTGSNLNSKKTSIEKQYSICWCPDRGPSSLVVGVGPIVKIYRKDSNGKWAQTEIMRCGDEKDDKSGELVTDVSWSPSFGRAAQFIAVGSTFGKIRIYKIFDDISKSKTGQYKKELIVEFLNDENKRDIMEGLQRGSRNAVWKVDWNAMGNVLSCCSDDGCVRLWKAGYLGDWMCLAVLKSE